jgi:hypothetical protein
VNGAVWMSSTRWPLKDKLGRSDFLTVRVDRLQRLPDTDIAWANPAKRPAQAAILGGNSTINGAMTGATAGGNAAGEALASTGRSTDSALTVTANKTSGALGTATRNTGHALRTSWRAVRNAVGGGDTPPTPETEKPK